MKKTNKFLIILAVALSLFVVSCDEETIDDMFGDPVEKYLGTWKCEENGDLNGHFGPFNVEIIRNPENSAEILIRNFNYLGSGVSAMAIVTQTTITIPQQFIGNNSIAVQGNGNFQNGEILLNYSTNDGADLENVSARFYR